MTQSRYVLVDFMHLAHRFIHAEPLSTTVNINGEVQYVDTTIPNHVIKAIYRYGGKGLHYTGVFLEGGNSKRKEYFRNQRGAEKMQGYKGARARKGGAFFDGTNLAVNLMSNGQVSLYRVQGMEADDCIGAIIQKIKSVDQTTPIDVITNDSDLLPLVDEQVSIYMRGTRQHAEPGCPEHRLYYQVTPDTWEEYLSYTSAYRDFLIPYNSMLLFKMMRGDKADEVTGATKGYGGKRYTKLMETMLEDGVDFPNIFRYGVDFDEKMRPVLNDYFDEETVDYMKFIYEGIRPQYANLEIPKQMELGLLQAALNPVKINLA